jgi:hypothetical protein
VVLRAWSGSALSSLLRPALRLAGVEPRSLHLSPLLVDDRPVASGTVPEGASVKVRLAVPEPEGGAIQAAEAARAALEEAWGLETLQLDVRRVSMPPGLPLEGPLPERSVLHLEHWPTMYTFRSWRILYPSPTRLVYSAARTAYEALGLDLRRTARVLSRRVELLASRTRIVEVGIGRGRRVRAFQGRASYAVYTARAAEALLKLLGVAEALGVGRGRGIGFGYFRILGLQPAEGSGD